MHAGKYTVYILKTVMHSLCPPIHEGQCASYAYLPLWQQAALLWLLQPPSSSPQAFPALPPPACPPTSAASLPSALTQQDTTCEALNIAKEMVLSCNYIQSV